MWRWVLEHQTEMIVAVVLAIVFALIFGVIIAFVFEALGLGSRVRDSIRRYKNKLAERSVKQLRKRIAGQEAYRNSISTDTGLIIVLIRTVLLTLFSLTCAFVLFFIAHGYLLSADADQRVRMSLDFGELAYLGLALLGAFAGIRLAKLDTEEKAKVTIAELDVEIAGMKDRLALLNQADANKLDP